MVSVGHPFQLGVQTAHIKNSAEQKTNKEHGKRNNKKGSGNEIKHLILPPHIDCK